MIINLHTASRAMLCIWFIDTMNTAPIMLDTKAMRELAVTIQSRFEYDQKQRIPTLTKQTTTKYQLG